MTVNAGELNKRIKIIRRQASVDADGYEKDPTEETVHTCWAKFSQTSGTEAVKNNAGFAQLKVRFLIRYTSKTIDRKMLVHYAGTDYEIVYINGYGDSRTYLEIWCERLTMEG